eukprot:m.202923 g.202923  ORF g.202923 m.202923 type:complete len:62 (-) comp32840_c0_seq1:124-309(-)
MQTTMAVKIPSGGMIALDNSNTRAHRDGIVLFEFVYRNGLSTSKNETAHVIAEWLKLNLRI